MSAKRSLVFILCLCQWVQPNALYAQDKPKSQFGKVSPTDFVLPSNPIIDSNAKAVILSDVGNIHFVGNQHNDLSYVLKKQTRIKIIDKKAFDLATVQVYRYIHKDGADKIDNISATCYNLENGRVVETKLDKHDIFETRYNEHHLVTKFTVPSVKEGSIIEYSYALTSEDIYSLPEWEFQSADNPCLWSELEVEIPQVYSYAVIRQGIHAYCIDKGERGAASYNITQQADISSGSSEKSSVLTVATLKHHWAIRDIPGINIEYYLSTPDNFIDKLQFQLAGSNNGYESQSITNTWKKMTEELLGESDFGLPLENDNDWLDDLVNKITANTSGQLSQAKAIYYYISSQFTCTNHNYHYLLARLQDVIQKRGGTVGDMNLLLIAMLRREHISADPVILSTTEHGYTFSQYPVDERLNYVIVRAKIDGKIYFLDAAHRQLGFGQLADNCYNGYSRIISNKDSGYVYLSADSLKETKTTMVIMTNGEKGGLEGSYQSTFGPQESYDTREEISRTGQKKYFSSIQTAYGDDLEITNTGVDSLDRLEDPLGIHYDFIIKQEANSPVFYFTPLLAEAYRRNPFQAADRKYPVEMPYAIDYSYLLNMEIPVGYKVEELPKSVKVALNVGDGSFEYLVSADATNIQLRTHVKLNRARFLPEDYASLRDFFAYIVKKESEQIVLKKK
jgi:hypothetical protein